MTIALSFSVLNRLWPRAPHSLAEGMVNSSAAVFAKYGLKTAAEVVDLMAQCSVECEAGESIEENLNYTAARLVQVWPSKFRSVASAAPFAHNPKALADYVYGGRMGNKAGTDDGWNYRGRCIVDVTGHDNYKAVGDAMGIDLVSNPSLINDPDHFLEAGCAYWRMNGLNAYADKGDFRGETLRVNGGLTGFDLRQQWRARWQQEAALLDVADKVKTPAEALFDQVSSGLITIAEAKEISRQPAAPTPPDVNTIKGVQVALTMLGYQIGVDGRFGDQTRAAVVSFQRISRITLDSYGFVGEQTKAALRKALSQLTTHA